MKHGSSNRPRHAHRGRSEQLANYSLGGLLVYAAVIPTVVALLAAPTLVGAFAFGIASAAVVSRLRGRFSRESTDDSDTSNHSERNWVEHDPGP